MKVHHYGNTANNAFHNLLLLKKYAGVDSEYPIKTFGLDHAISAPAWEGVEFDVPDADWVASPDWTQFPAADAVNRDYADLPVPSATGEPSPDSAGVRSEGVVTALRSRIFGPLRGQAWARPAVEFRDRRVLARRPILPEPTDAINIVYGQTPLVDVRLSKDSRRTIYFEHGTLRWMADGHPESRAFREAYRDEVKRAAHLWVTNLDPRTLEIAEDVAPGRWTALPHPYTPDPRIPFAESPRRAKMLRATNSEHLLLLPSSQNWGVHHNKGSNKALRAFVDLRRAGVDVGLVAVEWGHQVAESKEFLLKSGVAAHVTWVLPLARFALQRLIADVDVVWDQFGLDAFGGLALRVVEQGTPLISRGLTPTGERFIGGGVPWLAAASREQIVHQTTAVLEEMHRRGRDAVIAETRARYRGWLFARHSPLLTAEIQRDLYEGILESGAQPNAMPSDEWARRVRGVAG